MLRRDGYGFGLPFHLAPFQSKKIVLPDHSVSRRPTHLSIDGDLTRKPQAAAQPKSASAKAIPYKSIFALVAYGKPKFASSFILYQILITSPRFGEHMPSDRMQLMAANKVFQVLRNRGEIPRLTCGQQASPVRVPPGGGGVSSTMGNMGGDLSHILSIGR